MLLVKIAKIGTRIAIHYVKNIKNLEKSNNLPTTTAKLFTAVITPRNVFSTKWLVEIGAIKKINKF